MAVREIWVVEIDADGWAPTDNISVVEAAARVMAHRLENQSAGRRYRISRYMRWSDISECRSGLCKPNDCGNSIEEEE